MNMLIFILASFAMTTILTRESIFKWLRKLLPFKPFTCPNCLSVWVGIVLSFLFPTLISIYISWFLYGMISYTGLRIINRIVYGEELIMLDE